MVAILVYRLRSRVMVWRDARRLRPCDRLSSPPSVMLRQLTIGVNETSRCWRYNLLVEDESDGVESCNVSKTS